MADDSHDGPFLVVIELAIISGEYSSDESLDFSWSVTSASSTSLTLQLYPTTPYHISALGSPEKLRVSFNNKSLFISTQNHTLLTSLTERVLPQLVTPSHQQFAYDSTLQVLESAALALVLLILLLSLLLGESLASFWSFLSFTQLAVYF